MKGTDAPSAYPHLLSPGAIGGLRLRNRMIMGSMHTRLETLDRALEREIAFYEERAAGGIALIVTGGFAPHPTGCLEPDSPVMNEAVDLGYHRKLTASVQRHGAAMVLQLLHAGRYAKFAECVAPSALRSPINKHTPRELETAEVWQLTQDFARAAALAREAGYDGVEVMGSEGYLINQFLAPRTNRRRDEFGGDFAGRSRFALEIVKAIRLRVGADFPLVYRISALELVEEGMSGEEILALARALECMGVDALDTGIGWHEAPVPTVAYTVPRAAWSAVSGRLRAAVRIPVIATNRINTPEVAEQVLAGGAADFVSMARPMLADAQFALKVATGRPQEINVCIACNQACLDRVFVLEVPSCLVNPRALRELDLPLGRTGDPRRIAVVGAGPAGLAFAINAADRGHRVTLFERDRTIGGQLRYARRVPEKTEFDELLRYFNTQLRKTGVDVRLGQSPSPRELRNFERVVVATGVKPRRPDIPGVDLPHVVTYAQLLSGEVAAGQRVAILGAGGIGFDVAEYLVGTPHEPPRLDAFVREYAIDIESRERGGLAGPPRCSRSSRQITMMQRTRGKVGHRLSLTLGRLKRERLIGAGVTLLDGVSYLEINRGGVRLLREDQAILIAADTIVLCTGQESERALADELAACGVSAHVIGGAELAAELDAVRAIDQATRLAFSI